MPTTEHILDASPSSQLRRVRGVVERSAPAYPETIHIEVRDQDGRLWRFGTWDAEWAPHDPSRFQDRTVEGIELEPTGRMVWRFSGDVTLTVDPRVPQESDDDPSYWELHTPDGLFLEFGPGARWRVQPLRA